MSDRTAISSMPLYTNLDRVEKGLAALGIGPGDAIQPEQLFAIDQWHYHGIEAIRAAAVALESVQRAVCSISAPASAVLPATLPTPPDATSRRWNCNRNCTGSAPI